MSSGIVFDIQRCSLHDGPGIRTTVFLKGCNLRCEWCHNPESFDTKPQLWLNLRNCTGCGACVEICPSGAMHKSAVEPLERFSPELCKNCFACAEVCPSRCLSVKGEEMAAEAVIETVLRDKHYYDTTGGGVTFSGGEPFLQPEFLTELLKLCKRNNLNTAVETALNIKWETIEPVRPDIDLFLVDIKAVTEALHKKITGVSNERILENIQRLSQTDSTVIIRVPVVPGVNESIEELEKIAGFMRSCGLDKVELLSFHKLAGHKYDSLAIPYKAADFGVPDSSKISEYYKIFEAFGIRKAEYDY